MSQTVTIKIEGMSCEHCANTVREALEELAGVSKVSVDLKKGEARLVADMAPDVALIGQAIADSGYEFVGLL